MKRFLIGIAGGTGSGKTTVALNIKEKIGEEILILDMDSYYKDHSNLPFEERLKINYDHPDAFDIPLLKKHIENLLEGNEIKKPIYSFVEYVRLKEYEIVKPQRIIILEGIFALFYEELRNLMDIKIYVDTDPDIRLIRRILRDTKERGRTLDSVIKQYTEVVRPMHIQFVEPTKRFADIIIPEGGFNVVAIDIVVSKVRDLFKEWFMSESVLRIYFPKEEIIFLQTLIESLEGKAMILYTYVEENVGIMDLSFDSKFLEDINSFLKEVSEYFPLIYEPVNFGNA